VTKKKDQDLARVDEQTVMPPERATASENETTPATVPLLFADGASQGAVLSFDGRYRYRLWRAWESGALSSVVFLMLNPSTADADVDDPTIRKCIGFAKRWSFRRLEVVNLFAWRATNPKEVLRVEEPVGRENDQTILERCLAAEWVIAAWGSEKFAVQRARLVTASLTGAGIHLRCLRKSKDGHPWHPLYVPYGTMPITYALARGEAERQPVDAATSVHAEARAVE
jgi:hypothetical protein